MRERLPWPQGVQGALCLTFDLDAETMWTSSDPKSAGRPVVMSQGRYDVEVGLPLVLELLARNELRHEGVWQLHGPGQYRVVFTAPDGTTVVRTVQVQG